MPKLPIRTHFTLDWLSLTTKLHFLCSHNKLTPLSQETIHNKIQILLELKQHFISNYDIYAKVLTYPLPNMSLNYTAWFARSCLFANQHIPIQDSFRAIKKSIVAAQLITPPSCTLMCELLPYFKFEGDEFHIIDILCTYYETNIHKFTSKQQRVFWRNYMKLMSEKAHGPVKFRKLQRCDSQVRDQTRLAELVAQQISARNIRVNKQLIKSNRIGTGCKESWRPPLPTQNYIQFTLHIPIKLILARLQELNDVQGLNVINNRKIESELPITIRVQELETPRYSQSPQKVQPHNIIMSQILYFHKQIAKNWKIIFHHNIRNQNIYKNPARINQLTNGSIDPQKLAEYYKHSNYHNAVYYNNTNMSKKTIADFNYQLVNTQNQGYKTSAEQGRMFQFHPFNIEHILTLILGMKTEFVNEKKVLLYNGTAKKSEQSNGYLSYAEMHECYGYAKLCRFHHAFSRIHQQLQGVQNHDEKVDNQIYEDLLFSQEDQQHRQKLQLLRSKINRNQEGTSNLRPINRLESKILSEWAMKKTREIGVLKLDSDYHWTLQQSQPNLGNLVSDAYWSFEYLSQDFQGIWDIILKESVMMDNPKFIVATHQSNSLQLAKHFLQGKFITIPYIQIKNEKHQAIRQQLTKQLLQNI